MRYAFFLAILMLVPLPERCAYAQKPEEWIPLLRPTTNNLNTLSFVSRDTGWIAGNSGTILRTNNGGKTWITQDAGIGADIHDMFFLNEQLGWALAFEMPSNPLQAGGTVFLSTTDGGSLWQRKFFPDEYFYDVTFTSPVNGWMGGVAGRFIGTTNGGSAWFDAVIDSEHVFNMPVRSIRFRTPDHGYAVGGVRELIGVIWRTTNGGTRWKQITLGDDLHDVHFFDSLHVLCAGGGLDDGSGMARTSDGGASWTFGYLGILGISESIAFRTGAEGWVTLSFAGSYLHTVDGGQSWTVGFTPDTTAANDVTFPDSTTGYMVGSNGLVMKHQTVIASQDVTSGWNLMSLPLQTFMNVKDSLYPGAVSRAFRYQAGYQPEDTLRSGTGYWLKFAHDTSVSVRGTALTEDSIHLAAKWNLVGTISDPVPVTAVFTIPPGILVSDFFEFNGGYATADTLKPEKGYWVKAVQAGVVILQSQAATFRPSK